MQRDENLLCIKYGQKLMPFTCDTVRWGLSTPTDLVYWTFIQTGRRSDPGVESVLTVTIYRAGCMNCHTFTNKC